MVTVPGAVLVLGGGPDPVHASLQGVQLAQGVVAVAGVQVLAGEYSTGMIATSWLAVPRRLPVLAAKAVWLLAGVSAAGIVAVGGSVLLGHALSWSYPDLWSPAVFRAAGGSVVYLCLVALLGLGVAAVLRNAAMGAGCGLGVVYLGPAILGF